VKFDVVTIFPSMVESFLADGVVGRASRRGLLDVAVHDLRQFTTDRHRSVDDVPYGGGPGMVMKLEPFLRVVEDVERKRGRSDAVILTSPQGVPFTHATAMRLSRIGHIVLLCGRYEAVDERVCTRVVSEEISIGDYVLSGGELPAMVILDAVGRLVPGVVGDAASVRDDSFGRGLLDHPHYTRPADVDGDRVPEVLLSGDHAEIRRWRKYEAVKRTLERRPDLLSQGGPGLDEEEREVLQQLRDSESE
jgi:tRNA (guanine37-N1)-methyltransferase